MQHMPSQILSAGEYWDLSRQELVSPSFAISPAMQMSVTQRLFRKKPVMIMTEYSKQHLMTKYYEIIRLNTEKKAPVARADTSFAFM